MTSGKKEPGKNKKRVILFLSLDPPKTMEGTVTLPGPKVRLSDLVNDDRPFLAIEDAALPDGWLQPRPGFILLNKSEVKLIVEAQ